MTLEGWEDLADESRPSHDAHDDGGEPLAQSPAPPTAPLAAPPAAAPAVAPAAAPAAPPPQYTPSATNSLILGNAGPSTSTPRLHVLAATWGGIVVTPAIQAMITPEETITIDMRSLHAALQPDPLPYVLKTLSVLYEYEDSDGPCLVNVSETAQSWPAVMTAGPAPPVVISPEAHMIENSGPVSGLGTTWHHGAVEILAVMYATQRIQQPAVLEELGKYFEGQTDQLRMTNSFFQCDPWPKNKKTWTVYFRFVDTKKVQVVTGVESGALEAPWSRY